MLQHRLMSGSQFYFYPKFGREVDPWKRVAQATERMIDQEPKTNQVLDEEIERWEYRFYG